MSYSLGHEASLGLTGITHALVEANNIHDNRGCRGMVITAVSSSVRNNILDKNGATAIDFYDTTYSDMTANTVRRHKGAHANGLTLYKTSGSGCQHCTVIGNVVTDSNAPLTFSWCTDITLAYNVFQSPASDAGAISYWSSPGSNVYIYNNVIISEYSQSLNVGSGLTGLVVKNNIIGGTDVGTTYPGGEVPGIHENNLYTKLGVFQQPSDWSYGPGEFLYTNVNNIWVDPANKDYRLKAGSPAIDAGTNVGLSTDIAGTAVPQGTAPDIGAYEYVVPGASITSWSVLGTHGGATQTTSVTDGYVEPRTQGITKIRVAFCGALNGSTVSKSVVGITGDSSGNLSGRVDSVTLVGDRTLEIALNAALPNVERCTVSISPTLKDANGNAVTGDLDIRLATLIGDVNGSGKVTAADLLAVRGQVDQIVGPGTYGYDVTGSSAITGDDLQVVRSHLGEQLP